MIPLHKLLELPRSLRLRKAANLFGGAEYRLLHSGQLSEKEAEYLASLLELLLKDEGFNEAEIAAFKAAQPVLASANLPPANPDEGELRRALNTVRHVLLAQTGRYQADWDFIEIDGVLDPSKRRPFAGMQVYLEDIRSPFNVGSMFRAAESFGAEKLWLSPLCADPRHKRAQRTAMGCVDLLPWERFPQDPFDGSVAAEFLAGPFFCLETAGTPLADFSFPPRGILIAGAEELGVSPLALAAAEASLGRVSIPTRGAKGSLNVSVAFGIVMQAWAADLRERLTCPPLS
ncbi:MAG: TrmH family RNA methyltransferase [Treponema sp.]|nr:TrmH family RNA methyltransferase [Treponema sp.]